MSSDFLKKIFTAVAIFVAVWLGVRYALPVALPFLLGWGLALAAEPLVKRLSGAVPRPVAAGLGVTATLAGVAGIGALLGAVAVRQVKNVTTVIPDLQNAVGQGMTAVQDFMVNLSQNAPESIQPLLQRTAQEFFSDGSVLLQQLTHNIPGAVGTALGWVGDGVLGVGTGILSAFLISARLPKLRTGLQSRLPKSWNEKYKPALLRVRRSLGGWLKAQLKLSAVTWGIVTVGFLLLRIPHAPAWAALVAVVDAIPILGTGTVLVPWAAVCLLQKESLRAIGLLCTYGVAAITRTVLEPRLVGRQLGLDPLATLAALYVGYRFWGFGGLLLTPILASAAKSLIEK